MTTKLLVVGATVLIAWTLKRHYADAHVDHLWWILAPTAQVAGLITAASFEMQAGEGYLSRERLFLIAKSCAGINFTIAAFGMVMFVRWHRAAAPLSAVRLLGTSLLVAYVATVVVNATRIAIAMWLAARPIARTGFSSADVHRIEGIAVYFGGLLLLYELTLRFDRRADTRAAL
jgi:exosortase K